MSGVYADTSELAKFLIDEAGRDALPAWVGSSDARLTYDERLADATHAVGLLVLAPGSDAA